MRRPPYDEVRPGYSERLFACFGHLLRTQESKRVSEKSQQAAGTCSTGLHRTVFAAISCRFRASEVALGRLHSPFSDTL
jgi:hypothetical protein